MRPEQLEYRVSQRIRELRTLRGMSQSELAAEVGCQKPHISDLERGIKSPGIATIAKLAEALDVEPEELFSEILQNA